MAQTVAELLEAALALPEPQRAELADLLAASVASPSGLHPEWAAEARRRAAEMESGAVQPVPLAESRRRLQALIEARKGNG
ncbi:MAG: addiction module protein [Gemmataceae bacterium]|nr:addiction module protein [Gemmataceae bacterium]